MLNGRFPANQRQQVPLQYAGRAVQPVIWRRVRPAATCANRLFAAVDVAAKPFNHASTERIPADRDWTAITTGQGFQAGCFAVLCNTGNVALSKIGFRKPDFR